MTGEKSRSASESFIFSPVKYRYSLAAAEIDARDPQVLDVGGYLSRKAILDVFLGDVEYTSVNVGPAWYTDESSDIVYAGGALPLSDSSFDFVISVDTIEHVAPCDRNLFMSEVSRVARKAAIVVTPFQSTTVSDEEYILRICKRFDLNPPPSLVQHVALGLPSCDDIALWSSEFGYKSEFHTDRYLYWSYQNAMLINRAVFGLDAERINRMIQRHMEDDLIGTPGQISQASAYRAVLVCTKHTTSAICK